MNISKEAIEAAAEAMSGWQFIEHEPGCGCGEHTELSEPARTHYAHAALEAAAPMLMAQAWDEGELGGYENAKFEEWPPIEPNKNPYRKEKP